MRAGVGIVVADPGDRILVIERRQMPGHWQMPQGGLEAEEEPLAAAWRELEEETGLTRRDVEFHRVHERWLAYELPAEARSEKTGRGQVQQWFLFRCRATAPPLRLGKEAGAADWRPAQEVLHGAVGFRRDIYREVLTSFALLPDRDQHLEYLHLEFEHCAQSMLSNEELGDRRFGNYLTFVGFLVAALALIAEKHHDALVGSAMAACAVSALLGVLTFARIIDRNIDTARLTGAMNRMRAVLASGMSWRAAAFAAPNERRFKWLPKSGGIAESLALFISVFAAVAVYLLAQQRGDQGAVIGALLTAVATWVCLGAWATLEYRRAEQA